MTKTFAFDREYFKKNALGVARELQNSKDPAKARVGRKIEERIEEITDFYQNNKREMSLEEFDHIIGELKK